MDINSIELWNRISHENKVMIAVIKKASYTYGNIISYDDLTLAILDNLPGRTSRSMPGLVTNLHKLDFTKSEDRFLRVTNKGQEFIFNNQTLIEDWAKENSIKYSVFRL